MRGGGWWPAGAWALAILVGTSIPGDRLPPMFPHADKVAHLFLYGVLGALVARALHLRAAGGRATARALGGALLAIVAFGAFDEWHQQFVPYRSMDPADLAADTLGAAVGISLLTSTLRSEQRT